tara:strand:+ start:11 stop:553 length:543 start_codon:yes stop_codon:yes gene_type:complete
MSSSIEKPLAAGDGPDNVDDVYRNKTECKGVMKNVLYGIRDNFNHVKKKFIGTDKEMDKETDKKINANIKVYANKFPNSKGYSINGYKVDIENEEYPFSTADEVNYFLENLIQNTENNILKPDNPSKQDPDTFFKSYKVSIPLFPIKTDSKKEDMKTGGKKNTIKRKRKKHNKSKKNKQK